MYLKSLKNLIFVSNSGDDGPGYRNLGYYPFHPSIVPISLPPILRTELYPVSCILYPVFPFPMNSHRDQFPGLQNKFYFNYGGQGTMPQAAIDAIFLAHQQIQELGPFSNSMVPWIEQTTEKTKTALADLLRVTPDTITLTENVTVGCNIAMWGIDWQKGDHLLLTDCEHHAVVAIAQEISRRFGVEVTTCPILATCNQGDPPQIIAEHLRPQTRLVVVSHVLWNTGQVLELDTIAQLCNANGTRLLVDAAQSVGVLPLDLFSLGVDFYAFTGHKWLCGAAGLGGLYVRRELQETLRPTFVGWRSTPTDINGQPTGWHRDGRKYEIATSDYPLWQGLVSAIAVHEKWGNANQRHKQICTNSRYLWEQLQQIPQVKSLLTSPPRSGLVSFQIDSNDPLIHSHLVKKLESQRIYLRTIAHPNCVRACVHYFTLKSEIDTLVEAVKFLNIAK